MKKVSKLYVPSRSFAHVCRVCLSKHNVLIPINEINLTHNLNLKGSAENVNLITVFEKFCNVKVDASDNKPQRICEFCINMACKTYNFFQLFLYSNAMLDKKLQEEKSLQGKLTQNKTPQSNADTEADTIDRTQHSPENVPTQDKTLVIVNPPDEKACINIEMHIENTESKPDVQARNTQHEGDTKKRKLTHKRSDRGSPRKRRALNNRPDLFSGIDPSKADALRFLLKMKNKNSREPEKEKPREKPKITGRPKLTKIREIEYNNDIFRCRLCPKIFHDITKVVEHFKDEHKDARQCILCPRKWQTKNNLYHVAAHSPKALVCRICQLYFESQDELDSHKENIDHTDIRKCPKCQKSFRMPGHVRDHMNQVHLKKETYQCKTCGKLFRYYHNMRRHEVNIHGSEKRFLCQECGQSFSVFYTLKAHIQKVHKMSQEVKKNMSWTPISRRKFLRVKKAECEICQKKFFTWRQLLLHSEIHPEFKDYRCDLCSEVLETNKEYINHYKTHQKFQCPNSSCDKLFITKERAFRHKYNHDKKISCQFCDRTFRTKTSLDVHVNVHTGERPFVCEQCGAGFKQTGHLRVHMIAHHGGRKPWQCRLCDKAFNFSHGLRCHMRSHRGEKPFPCPYCKKMFRDTSGRHKHVKKEHPNKMEEFLIYKEEHQDEEIQKVDRETEKMEGYKNESDEEEQDT